MHSIAEVKVQNFRSIRNATFQLSTLTPLVGYNNAGKSNILQAINWVLKKSTLSTADFYDAEEMVSVIAIIKGITDQVLDSLANNHRNKIAPFIVDERLTIRRTQPTAPASAKDVKLDVLKPSDGEDDWEPNPTGIDQAISQLFPDPIFIGAMENATEDVAKFGASTTIGKLLKEIIEDVSNRQKDGIANALAAVESALSANGENKDPTLTELDQKIQSELTQFFPGLSAKIHIPTPEFSDFLKGATIKFFEDGFDQDGGDDAKQFGHGAQRSVQISLLKCLSEIKRRENRTTLLLIDEPELYLHPQAIESIRSALEKLSKKSYQIIFSTHSPHLITSDHASKTLIIRRNPEHGTKPIQRLSEAVKSAINNDDTRADLLFSIGNSPEFLFTETVILAEGKTERTLLPTLFQKTHEKTLNLAKRGLISVGGVGDIIPAMKVLETMGLKTKAIVDLDFVFNDGCRHNYIDPMHPSITKCKEILNRLKDDRKIDLNEGGLPKRFKNENGETITAAKAFEMLAAEPDSEEPISEFHRIFKEKDIWVWSKGAIEAHLGLANKKPRTHREFIENLVDGNVLQNLPDGEGVEKLLNWLES